jgi:hypothetical protein
VRISIGLNILNVLFRPRPSSQSLFSPRSPYGECRRNEAKSAAGVTFHFRDFRKPLSVAAQKLEKSPFLEESAKKFSGAFRFTTENFGDASDIHPQKALLCVTWPHGGICEGREGARERKR